MNDQILTNMVGGKKYDVYIDENEDTVVIADNIIAAINKQLNNTYTMKNVIRGTGGNTMKFAGIFYTCL